MPVFVRFAMRMEMVARKNALRKLLFRTLCGCLLSSAGLHAQDISGIWQGAFKAEKDQRVVLEVKHDTSDGWKAKFYEIDQADQATDPRPVSSFALHDGILEFALDQDAGSYTGKLDLKDGAIAGIWTQGKPYSLKLVRVSSQTAWRIDPTPHQVHFIGVEPGVKLEVLDWGGSGRAVILLPGLGDTAHVFDQFALKLAAHFHVYGITTRGFGDSSSPPPNAANYSADRLGDDIVAVITALKLERPILAGHSVAGEELSSVATRYPDKISGLVYIDAGYAYALYDKVRGDPVLDAIELRNKFAQTDLGLLPRNPKQLDDLLAATDQLQETLQQRKDDLASISRPHPIQNPVSIAILNGQQRYTKIAVPVLAIFNVPHSPVFLRTMQSQVDAFKTQVPQARIVQIPQADHYVFQTNEADVLREMNGFIQGLR